MQPYFLPYLGYFQLISAVDKFIILDDVNYIKKGFINRNYLLLNNERFLFTLPVQKASQNRFIKDHSVTNNLNWSVKLLNTIEQSYSKSPFYQSVLPLLKTIFTSDIVPLSEFIHFSISEICTFLDINTEIIPSSSIYDKKDLMGENRIIDICKTENTNTYINPIGGIDLYTEKKFDDNQIQLKFIKMDSDVFYLQNKTQTFIPNLSIIDVLMNNSRHKVIEFVQMYTLIKK